MPIHRRHFLKSSLGAGAAVAVGASGSPWLVRAVEPAGVARGERVLIVLQMGGGNDGLNTVVPFTDDAYARNRPTIRLAPGALHKISPTLGLHPKMQALKRIFDRGWLTIVQGVGYPKSSRQHPEAMRGWQTARPDDRHVETGWVGRGVDLVYRPDQGLVPAMFFGPGQAPQAAAAQKALVPAIRTPDQCLLQAAAGPGGEALRDGLGYVAHAPRPAGNPLLSFVQNATRGAYADSARVEAVVRRRADKGHYPAFPLARTLQGIASMVRAEIGIRVFLTDMAGGNIGGFDNHANQAENHAALLEEFSESVAALFEDLARDRLQDRVLLVTFSEFGRTVAENGRRGTDHGAAAPMFLVGGGLRGGLVGRHPSLTDLDAGSLRVHTDFRSVYGTLLDRWLGWDSPSVLGGKYPQLPLVNG
jgi:uncharacterized protein (DUF1501 family)